jgi:hypothetical protein
MIKNAEIVESYFGYWPLFCDGKIKNFTITQPGTITLVILYIDTEKRRGAEICLKFSGVTDVELSELRSENVIDTLCIPEEFPAQITLEACCGLAGSFKSTAVEVCFCDPNPFIVIDTFR